ncbi:MAG: DUF615 domain-containing protein [Pseudomonadota bacterium]
MNDESQSRTGRISKSQAKREAKAIEALAAYLIELSPEQRRKLDLDQRLIESAELAASISRGAARRERLSLAKRLRADPDAVSALAAARDAEQRTDTAQRQLFKRAESIRDAMLRDVPTTLPGNADDQATLAALLQRYRDARNERELKHCYRELFRGVLRALENQRGADA